MSERSIQSSPYIAVVRRINDNNKRHVALIMQILLKQVLAGTKGSQRASLADKAPCTRLGALWKRSYLPSWFCDVAFQLHSVFPRAFSPKIPCKFVMQIDFQRSDSSERYLLGTYSFIIKPIVLSRFAPTFEITQIVAPAEPCKIERERKL